MSSELFNPASFNALLSAFLNNVSANADVAVDSQDGSIIKALAQADTMNHLFIQSQIGQVALNSRLDTATGEDLDTLVNQFSPPFTSRLRSQRASSAPLPPTTLQAGVASNSASAPTRIWVASVQGWSVGQSFKISRAGKQAAGVIVEIQPTTMLTANATQGITTLTVQSTTGMQAGMSLMLVDGVYSVEVTVIGVVSATQVQINPLAAAVATTFQAGSTVVTLLNVLAVTQLTYTSGSTYADLLGGSLITATSLLEGVKFYRNKADASAPGIPARVTDSSGNIVQAGYVLQTRLEGIQYEVVADTTNENYDPVSMIYRIPANLNNVFVAVEAVNPGTGSNIIGDTLTILPSPLSGIDGATNPYPIQNGVDEEEDAALRTRFRSFIGSLATSNTGAMEAAISSVQSDIQFSVLENVAADGVTAQPGNIVVVVSDSNGILGTDLYSKVYATVNKVRPLTTTFMIKPPTLAIPSITMTIAVHSDYMIDGGAAVRSAVQTAIFNSFSGTAAGMTMYFNNLVKLAMDTPGVTDVLSVSVDGNGWTKQVATIATPVATITNSGTPGTAVYTYYVVAYDATGRRTALSAEAITNTGNATLTTTNYNNISWGAITGATKYDVLKKVGSSIVLLATTTGTTAQDKGTATFPYTLPPYTLLGSGPADVVAGPLQLLRPPLSSIVIS